MYVCRSIRSILRTTRNLRPQLRTTACTLAYCFDSCIFGCSLTDHVKYHRILKNSLCGLFTSIATYNNPHNREALESGFKGTNSPNCSEDDNEEVSTNQEIPSYL